MRKSKRRIGISSATIVLLATMSACGQSETVNNKTVATQPVKIHESNTNPNGYLQIQRDNSPEHRFENLPIYYQNDYKNVSLGTGTIETAGNLVTCLAMIDSYYTYEYITPEDIVEKYGKYTSEKGVDSEGMIEAVASHTNRLLQKEKYNPYRAYVYLEEYGAKILLHIPHKSIYGEDSTYLILNGIDENGDYLVRDPNMENIKEHSGTINQENAYSAFEVAVSATSEADMYIFEGGRIEDEDYREYFFGSGIITEPFETDEYFQEFEEEPMD